MTATPKAERGRESGRNRGQRGAGGAGGARQRHRQSLGAQRRAT